MSAPFIIPFNNEPSLSTTLRTANYTVPTGKYARVIPISYDQTWTIPNNSNGLTTTTGMQLNGSSIGSKSFSVTASMTNTGVANRTNTFFIPSGTVTNPFLSCVSTANNGVSIGYEILTGATTQTLTVSAATAATVGIGSYPSLPNNNAIRLNNLSTASTVPYTNTWTFSCNYEIEPFWVRAGDIINTNTWGRFIAEEFTSIS